jgi:hypothetical protein
LDTGGQANLVCDGRFVFQVQQFDPEHSPTAVGDGAVHALGQTRESGNPGVPQPGRQVYLHDAVQRGVDSRLQRPSNAGHEAPVALAVSCLAAGAHPMDAEDLFVDPLQIIDQTDTEHRSRRTAAIARTHRAFE